MITSGDSFLATCCPIPRLAGLPDQIFEQRHLFTSSDTHQALQSLHCDSTAVVQGVGSYLGKNRTADVFNLPVPSSNARFCWYVHHLSPHVAYLLFLLQDVCVLLETHNGKQAGEVELSLAYGT